MNRFGLQTIPPPLLAFAATVVNWLKLFQFWSLIGSQIYFILHGTANFESKPEGDEEHQLFFTNRLEEIHALGPKSKKHIFGFLEEEVFGVKQKQRTAEQRRQREFSNARLQEIKAQAAREDTEEEGSGGEE
jgi:hypothetical protein